MTIAELLVQEMGRELTSHCPETCGCASACNDPVAQALGHARAIVAAIYGEPCGDFEYGSQLPPRPSDECLCGWPRSCHGAKP